MTARKSDIDAWSALGHAGRAAAATRGYLRGAQAVAARSHRAMRIDAPPAVPSEPEPRQEPLPRPHFALIWDANIIIRPDRPAPTKRYTSSLPTPFQDDLSAIGDHGSPGRLPLTDDLRQSATGSTALWARDA